MVYSKKKGRYVTDKCNIVEITQWLTKASLTKGSHVRNIVAKRG